MGLDYRAVEVVLPHAANDYEEARTHDPSLPEWDEGLVWDGLQVIEESSLQVQHEQLEQRQNQGPERDRGHQ